MAETRATTYTNESFFAGLPDLDMLVEGIYGIIKYICFTNNWSLHNIAFNNALHHFYSDFLLTKIIFLSSMYAHMAALFFMAGEKWQIAEMPDKKRSRRRVAFRGP